MPAESSDVTARGWDQQVSYLAGVKEPSEE
jgi:hypothetical protein